MSFGSFLKGIQEPLTNLGNAMMNSFFALFARKYINATGNVNDYQSFVYPPPNTTFGTANQMYIPLYANILQTELLLPDWDMWIKTANKTGMAPFPLDTGNVTPYPNSQNLHGRHDLIVWKNDKRFSFPVNNYGMNLLGLQEVGSINTFTTTQLGENKPADMANLIVFVFPFLVTPHQSGQEEDVTRFFGVHTIRLGPGDVVFICTMASSVFNVPGSSPQPTWYAAMAQFNSVLDCLLLFVAKVISEDVDEKVTESGNPTGTLNPDVIREMVPIPGTY